MHLTQNTIVNSRREYHLPECLIRSILHLQCITARNVADHIQVGFARLPTVDSFLIGLFDDSAMTTGSAGTNVSMNTFAKQMGPARMCHQHNGIARQGASEAAHIRAT